MKRNNENFITYNWSELQMPLLFWVKKSSDTAENIKFSCKASFCKRPPSALLILCSVMQGEPVSKEGIGIYTASDSGSLIYTEKSVLMCLHYLGVKWAKILYHLWKHSLPQKMSNSTMWEVTIISSLHPLYCTTLVSQKYSYYLLQQPRVWNFFIQSSGYSR